MGGCEGCILARGGPVATAGRFPGTLLMRFCRVTGTIVDIVNGKTERPGDCPRAEEPKKEGAMERVEVARCMMGIAHMQVCAVADATDEEILNICNKQNPAGTQNGWMVVIRDDKEYPQCNPIRCNEHPDRMHFMISC